jgi:hypothetical protein
MHFLTAKNMVAAVIVTLLIGFVLFAVANWGRRVGVESATIANVPNAILITKQHECLQLRDWECLRVGNEFQAKLLYLQMKTLKDKDLVERSMEEVVDEFLSWYETNYPEE